MISETQTKVEHLEQELAKITGLFDDTSEELGKIRDDLHQTNATLKNTKTKLKEIIGDRDGLEFLVENYRKTEERLYENATTLKEVVESSTCDNGRLHSKLERKQVVERSNTRHKDIFKTQYSSTLKDLEANLDAFRCKQEEQSKELVQWIGNLGPGVSDR